MKFLKKSSLHLFSSWYPPSLFLLACSYNSSQHLTLSSPFLLNIFEIPYLQHVIHEKKLTECSIICLLLLLTVLYFKRADKENIFFVSLILMSGDSIAIYLEIAQQ